MPPSCASGGFFFPLGVDSIVHIVYTVSMAVVYIKNVPDELRNKFKALCAEKGSNMREELMKYMKEVVEKAAREG